MNKRLRKLRKEILKLTLKEFGKSIALSPSALGDIENERRNLQDRHIKLISQTFNVNEDWLRNGTEPIFKETENDNEDIIINKLKKKYDLDERSTSLIKSFASLDNDLKNPIIDFIFKAVENYYLDNPNKIDSFLKNVDIRMENLVVNENVFDELSITNTNIIELKLFNTPASAGTGNYIDNDDYELITVDLDKYPQLSQVDFAVRVQGDSMEPLYYNNDIVFVKEQPAVENGQIGIFIYEGESYIKKLEICDNDAYLVSINTKYKPIKINEHSDIKTCGLVINK